ncbi:MAG: histidine phosphatase family protein [Desulfuromonadales bacterium]|nr:histidine phosphatase family protein [Desulfuromonadales bacterium]
MKQLILLRHAKSSWKDPTLDDFDRPLNKRGEAAAPVMGRRLAARRLRPEQIVCSPARRTRMTAERVAAALGVPATAIEDRPELYAADLATLLACLRRLDDTWSTILLVGHNPGLTELANTLAPCRIDNIVTCGVVALGLPLTRWAELTPGCGRLLFYDDPKRIAEVSGNT